MKSLSPAKRPANVISFLPQECPSTSTDSGYIDTDRIRTDQDLHTLLPLLCSSLYNTLGPKQLEATYQRALGVELVERGVQEIEMEKVIPILYKNHVVGSRRADIVVTVGNAKKEEKEEDGTGVVTKVIMEVKACSSLSSEHVKQLEYYMAHFDIDDGYLINFPRETGFPSVDDLDFAFQQVQICAPSGAVHPISDMQKRSKVVVHEGPHIVKLVRARKSEVQGSEKEENNMNIGTGVKNSDQSSREDSLPLETSSSIKYGKTSKGNDCKTCLKIKGYCRHHMHQKP